MNEDFDYQEELEFEIDSGACLRLLESRPTSSLAVRRSLLWLQVVGLLDGYTGHVDTLYDLVICAEDLRSHSNHAEEDWFRQVSTATEQLVSQGFTDEGFDAARAIARHINSSLTKAQLAADNPLKLVSTRIKDSLIEAQLIPDERPSGADLATT